MLSTALYICLTISVVFGKPLANEGSSEQPQVPAIGPEAVIDSMKMPETSDAIKELVTVGSAEQLLSTATSSQQTLYNAATTDGSSEGEANATEYLTFSLDVVVDKKSMEKEGTEFPSMRSDQPSVSFETAESSGDEIHVTQLSSLPTEASELMTSISSGDINSKHTTSFVVTPSLSEALDVAQNKVTTTMTNEYRSDNLNLMFDAPSQVTPPCPTGVRSDSISRISICPWSYHRIEVTFPGNQTPTYLMEAQCDPNDDIDCRLVFETIPVVTAGGQLMLQRIAVACTVIVPPVHPEDSHDNTPH